MCSIFTLPSLSKRCRRKLRFPHQYSVTLAEECGKFAAGGGREEESEEDGREGRVNLKYHTDSIRSE